MVVVGCVVVGGAVVAWASSGGVGAVDVPASSLVLTGVLGVVPAVLSVDDRDNAGLVGLTGVSRSG